MENNKQETLEEVAERILANNIDGLRDALQDDDLFFFYKGVVQCYGEAMAKWQQEQNKTKYSEEEVIEFANWKDINCFQVMGSNHLFYIRDCKTYNEGYTNKELLETFKKQIK